MAETEDLPYNTSVDDFATPDDSETKEEDKLSPRNALVKELRAYCKNTIAEYNSFDVLHLPKNATDDDKIAVFNEMFNYKGLVHHLRQIESIINNKVREN